MCIFCQEKAGSGEHAFPDWLNPVLDKIPIVSGDNPPPIWGRVTKDFRSGESVSNSWKASEVASIRCKKVCHTCNTGWMADLEKQSAPLLIPMIEGKATALDLVGQLTVATWASKTAMVLEQVMSGQPSDGFTPTQCRTVMEQCRPPASFRVRVAMIEDTVPPLDYACRRISVQSEGRSHFKFHFHTIQIVSFVVQVTRLEPEPAGDGHLTHVAQPGDIEIPVFPPVEQFFWPPKRSLDNQTFRKYIVRDHDMPPGA